MPRPSKPPATTLRTLQYNAERMAKLSPFAADRDRFNRIAQRYREEADNGELESRPPPL